MSVLLAEVRAKRRLPPPAMARAIRESAGVSQERLAAELGVHRVTIARYEAGDRHPRGETLIAYIELLAQLQAESR